MANSTLLDAAILCGATQTGTLTWDETECLLIYTNGTETWYLHASKICRVKLTADQWEFYLSEGQPLVVGFDVFPEDQTVAQEIATCSSSGGVVAVGGATSSVWELVPTGLVDANGAPVFRPIITSITGVPSMGPDAYYFDSNGDIQVAFSTPFTGAASNVFPDSITWDKLFTTSNTTGQVKDVYQKTIINFDANGDQTGSPVVSNHQIDRDTAETLLDATGPKPKLVFISDENVDVTGATAVGLTVPTYAASARIRVEADNDGLIYTVDGNDPTADNGARVNPGGEIVLESRAELDNFKSFPIDTAGAIQTGDNAKLTVLYMNLDQQGNPL